MYSVRGTGYAVTASLVQQRPYVSPLGQTPTPVLSQEIAGGGEQEDGQRAPGKPGMDVDLPHKHQKPPRAGMPFFHGPVPIEMHKVVAGNRPALVGTSAVKRANMRENKNDKAHQPQDEEFKKPHHPLIRVSGMKQHDANKPQITDDDKLDDREDDEDGFSTEHEAIILPLVYFLENNLRLSPPDIRRTACIVAVSDFSYLPSAMYSVLGTRYLFFFSPSQEPH